MEKAYNISDLYFEGDYLFIVVDNQIIKVKLSDISKKLMNASEIERADYKISPSGYGIHWQKLDEDISINGLLRISK